MLGFRRYLIISNLLHYQILEKLVRKKKNAWADRAPNSCLYCYEASLQWVSDYTPLVLSFSIYNMREGGCEQVVPIFPSISLSFSVQRTSQWHQPSLGCLHQKLGHPGLLPKHLLTVSHEDLLILFSTDFSDSSRGCHCHCFCLSAGPQHLLSGPL